MVGAKVSVIDAGNGGDSFGGLVDCFSASYSAVMRYLYMFFVGKEIMENEGIDTLHEWPGQ